jgi:hypothetical protein
VATLRPRRACCRVLLAGFAALGIGRAVSGTLPPAHGVFCF